MKFAFDLDGTLITAQNKQVFLLLAIASRYGIPLSAVYIWERKRAGLSNFEILSEFGVENRLAQMISIGWLSEIETAYWLNMDTLFAWVPEILLALKRLGFELILITSRNNKYLMRQQVYRLGLNNFFQNIFCVSPKNAVLEKSKILNQVGAKFFIGDSEIDFESSFLSKVPFFGVTTGQRSEEFLRLYGVENISSSLDIAVNNAINLIK